MSTKKGFDQKIPNLRDLYPNVTDEELAREATSLKPSINPLPSGLIHPALVISRN